MKKKKYFIAISSPNPMPRLTLHECDLYMNVMNLQTVEIWKPHGFNLAEEPEDRNR